MNFSQEYDEFVQSSKTSKSSKLFTLLLPVINFQFSLGKKLFWCMLPIILDYSELKNQNMHPSKRSIFQY